MKLQDEVTQQQNAQQSFGNAYVQEQLKDNRRAVDELRRNTIAVERKLKENVTSQFTNPFRLAEEYRNQALIVNPTFEDAGLRSDGDADSLTKNRVQLPQPGEV